MDPATTSDELAAALDLRVHPPVDEALRSAGVPAFVITNTQRELALARQSPFAAYEFPACP